MNETFDDIDLAACSRRARRWAIGLVCLLAVNGSLVALALGGFGAAEPRPVAARPISTPLPAAKKPAAPLGTVPVPNKPDAPLAAKVPPKEPPAAAELTADNPPAEDPPSPPINPPPAPPVNVVPVAVDSLILMNPSTTGGEVRFAVDGEVHRLEAGEFLELPGRRERQIEFHRGDDFGYAKHQLDAGALAFGVGEAGWTLTLLKSDAARELLRTCRGKSR